MGQVLRLLSQPWLVRVGGSGLGHTLATHCPTLLLQKEVDETLTTNVWLEHVSRDRCDSIGFATTGWPSMVRG